LLSLTLLLINPINIFGTLTPQGWYIKEQKNINQHIYCSDHSNSAITLLEEENDALVYFANDIFNGDNYSERKLFRQWDAYITVWTDVVEKNIDSLGGTSICIKINHDGNTWDGYSWHYGWRYFSESKTQYEIVTLYQIVNDYYYEIYQSEMYWQTYNEYFKWFEPKTDFNVRFIVDAESLRIFGMIDGWRSDTSWYGSWILEFPSLNSKNSAVSFWERPDFYSVWGGNRSYTFLAANFQYPQGDANQNFFTLDESDITTVKQDFGQTLYPPLTSPPTPTSYWFTWQYSRSDFIIDGVINMMDLSFITERLNWFMRSDKHTINGLNAYRLFTNNTNLVKTIELGGGFQTYEYLTIRVFRRQLSGQESQIGGSVTKVLPSGGNSEWEERIDWVCPTTLINPDDSIVIKIYNKNDDLRAIFSTHRLNATKISNYTWIFYIWIQRKMFERELEKSSSIRSPYSYSWSIKFGSQQYNSRLISMKYEPYM